MCEWLSFGELSDVQLVCGGRSFSAHRAVLASVSTFLRRILLSSPDEVTTFIVLPDFDLEAMSSVMYYIYNGEVLLSKNKLGLFLEIVHAMQIYIDCQYLSKIQEDVKDKYLDLLMHCETISLDNDIFTLRFNDDKDQNIFNIKKCKVSQKVLMKYTQSNIDFYDNGVRCQNESELGESRLGNLKSPYEGRQRNSLLRDLFIETYPRNGNVNGLTESVLAISNEYYQSPASVLLANANCRYLSTDDAHTRLSKKATASSLHSSAVVDERLQRTCNCKTECGEVPASDDTDFLSFKYSANRNRLSTYCKSNEFVEVNKFVSIDRHLISENTCKRKVNSSFFDGLNPDNYQHTQNTEFNMSKDSIESKNHSVRKNKQMGMKSKSHTKVIFNQVLESPWNSRKPNNYRPFRRKENPEDALPTYEDEKIENDTNNNIQKPSLVIENNNTEIEVVGDNECKDASIIIENRESFKCTHCDQVFTSGESLAVHMRRHSTNARYTCAECAKTFSQLRNFKYHMSIHRGTREFAATCTVCGKYFNDRGYLSSHMKIHRNRKEYKCSLCPKSFNQRVAYNMHVRIHTGVKPHVCEECGKAFSRKMLLKQHQRTHSGERPYACPHCDKRFADRSNMTLHLRLHTGVKPFSCPMCPKSFTKKHHLKSHLNFHTGSKPYSCPRCALAFTQSSNMRTHYKKCTAPQPTTSNDDSLLPL